MSSLVCTSIDQLTLLNLNHIDIRSKNIVYGYTRRVQELLFLDEFDDDDVNRKIPKSVYLFCLELIDDHFMIQQSTHQWVFEGPVIDRMLNAVNQQRIQTDIFDACKMLWALEIYPDGDDGGSAGEFCVFLRNIEMPQLWEDVALRMTIVIKELSVQCTRLVQCTSEKRQSWGSEILSFQEFTNARPNKLTVSITLRVLEIRLDKQKQQALRMMKMTPDEKSDAADTATDACMPDFEFDAVDDDAGDEQKAGSHILYQYDQPMDRDHYAFEWKIDEALAQKIQNNLNNLPRRYESDAFYGLWKICLWPNDSNNRCTLALMMLGLPKSATNNKDKDKEAGIKARWKIGIKEGNVYTQKIDSFQYSDGWSNEMLKAWDDDVLTSTEYQTYTAVTIEVDIHILREEKDERKQRKQAVSVNDEWTRYMLQNGSMERAFMNRMSSLPMDEEDTTNTVPLMEQQANKDKMKRMKRKEVFTWLKEVVKLPQYYSLFAENGFDDLECFEGLTFAMLEGYTW
eukprot:CAMPEP_0202694768 /NCGR_PEP_ID=MMETSP1385-20130828/8542_1 /ASSEMBLY_ACC=CAM_ASM_000861 /TAXON_ID=933848 /ORGANISM="Elphidium margaritaceum" /LENGTH=512 /DNA_ID=CAMNT_0049350671 /DNA_START=28 /DNA_END=1563 /DNA_ORIENTATION=-